MKITKEQLKEIIKEELESLVNESEETPETPYDKVIGYYYIDGNEVIFTDKDGKELKDVPWLAMSKARIRKKQGDLK